MTTLNLPRKTRVAVLFGGRSGEHDVSLMSARSVLAALDPQRYEVIQVGITLDGNWYTGPDALEQFEKGNLDGLESVIPPTQPGRGSLSVLRETKMGSKLESISSVDVFFPVLHGPFGEDGTIQGLLELADAAYVGAGVAGSAVGMDKAIFKDVMRANKIPIVPSVLVLRSEIEKDIRAVMARIEREIGAYPVFTKPANLGSSVGISKCNTPSDLGEGLLEAARYDRRLVVEQGMVDVREIEVSVLGNEDPQTSVCGEILPSREFYSYESKYIDGTSGLEIPANLPEETSNKIREYAVRAYKAIDCAGMARADFFVTKNNEIYLNELNTLPGFTSISMYPKLWKASAVEYPQLVDRLIELALERKAQRDHTEHRRTA